MRVAVSGAGGFVGTAVVRALRDAGLTVVPLARRADAVPGAVAIGDLGDPGVASIVLPPIDALVHLAAVTHIGSRTVGIDDLCERVNVGGTARLLDAASRAGARHFVFLSSIKAIGESSLPGRPLDEETPPRPQDAYGRTKLAAEQLVSDHAGRSGMSWTIIRPPLVYGPGVGANFARLARLAGRKIPLPLGYEANRRSLIYVGNLAAFVRTCIVDPRARNAAFMISDGEDVSTAVLIRRIAAANDRRVRLIWIPDRLVEVLGRSARMKPVIDRLFGTLQIDAAKARRTLDWSSPFTMEDGLKSTFASDDRL